MASSINLTNQASRSSTASLIASIARLTPRSLELIEGGEGGPGPAGRQSRAPLEGPRPTPAVTHGPAHVFPRPPGRGSASPRVTRGHVLLWINRGFSASLGCVGLSFCVATSDPWTCPPGRGSTQRPPADWLPTDHRPRGPGIPGVGGRGPPKYFLGKHGRRQTHTLASARKAQGRGSGRPHLCSAPLCLLESLTDS